MIEFNRRDFLKLSGLGFGLGFLASRGIKFGENNSEFLKKSNKLLEEWEDGELPPLGSDIISNPEYWIGESGEKLRKKLSKMLFIGYEEIYTVVRELVLDNQKHDLGELNAEKTQSSIDTLTTDLLSRGREIFLAQNNGFSYIKNNLDDRYYETSSYVQMLMRLILYKNQVGVEQFVVESESLAHVEESLDSISNASIEQAVGRDDNRALWNRDWEALGSGSTGYSPLVLPFSYSDGYEVVDKPNSFQIDPYLSDKLAKPPVEYGENWYTKRPNKVKVINMDEEVATEITKVLKKIGLERLINKIILKQDNGLYGMTTSNEAVSELAIHFPASEELNLHEYERRKREFLSILFHEAYHVAKSRVNHLSVEDRMAVRNLELEILNIANPLSDLEKVFNPKGDDHGFVKDNEYSLAKYFLNNVNNMYDNMGSSAREILHEFSNVIEKFVGEDILSVFSVSNDDNSMEGLFIRLDKNLSEYTGITKLIAKTLLDSKNDILLRKIVSSSKDEDNQYFSYVVMPLVFTHLVLYKFKEVVESIAPNIDTKDTKLMKNYFFSLHRRMRSFIDYRPSNELAADLFSASMLTEEYGKHDVDYISEIRPKFEQIIKILRKNKLADISDVV